MLSFSCWKVVAQLSVRIAKGNAWWRLCVLSSLISLCYNNATFSIVNSTDWDFSKSFLQWGSEVKWIIQRGFFCFSTYICLCYEFFPLSSRFFFPVTHFMMGHQWPLLVITSSFSHLPSYTHSNRNICQCRPNLPEAERLTKNMGWTIHHLTEIFVIPFISRTSF